MNPALTTQSGLCAAIATASSASHCARSEYTDGSTTNVGMSASSARARSGDLGPVRSDCNNSRRVLRAGSRVKERLEVSSAARDQHHKPGWLSSTRVGRR